MIKIKRTTKPAYLDDPKVLEETAEAIKLFAPNQSITPSLTKKRKEFKYKRYSHAAVKDALKDMCNNKCAYCESSFLHVYYGDIEHFRPKKFVGTKKDQKIPGYYWLANDWNNLLLSCLFCNQAKTQMIEKEDELIKITLGKQNQFPLSNQTLYNRTRSHINWENGNDKKDDKARLIVNPCIDDPEKHFSYTKEGIVIPKKIKRNNKFIDDPKASASIEVYALQRIYLVQERKKRLVNLDLHINSVREVLKKLDDMDFNSNPVIINYYQDRLKAEIETLFYFTHRKMAYAAMCRQFVYEFLQSNLKKTKSVIRKVEESIHKKIDQGDIELV